ncbi:F0F1 ATP synthase subunit B [Tautonia rosea]|uniref:F0F1 ATP synthase subunit B n=1 Tax=Tautonia rosea TaxID=2728037 RepID=UPI001474A80F|nr:F0F1 ATP synthase subunit B [Tautonia rosea]
MLIDCLWIIAQASGGVGENAGSGGVLIHGFTVVAQVVNFLILVVLLRHFLYGRIIEAMDLRKQQIASRWDEAGKRQQAAKEETERYRHRLQELNERGDEILDDARKDAGRRREELIREARCEAEQLRLQWRHALRQDQEGFLDELRRRATEGACSIARRVLADLADAELERQIFNSFISRLKSLDEHHQERLRVSLGNPEQILNVRSAFNVPDDLRQALSDWLHDEFGVEFQLRYEIDPRLICGVELNTDGHKLAWDVSDSLDEIQQELSRVIGREMAIAEDSDEEAIEHADVYRT